MVPCWRIWPPHSPSPLGMLLEVTPDCAAACVPSCLGNTGESWTEYLRVVPTSMPGVPASYKDKDIDVLLYILY
jgi:hypothetical protein